MKRNGVKRGLVCLVAAVLLGGVNSPRASAADTDMTIDLPIVVTNDTTGYAEVEAVWGDHVLVAHEGTYRWSGDGGRTWAPIGLPGELSGVADCGFSRVSAGVATTACMDDPETGRGQWTAYSLVTNAQVGSSVVRGEYPKGTDALGARLLVDGGHDDDKIVDLSTTPATVTALAPGEHGLRLTDDGALSYKYDVFTEFPTLTWTLTISKVTASGSTTLKVITGLAYDAPPSASGDYVYYSHDYRDDSDPFYRCYFHISDPDNGGCVEAGGALPEADPPADGRFRVGGETVPTLERKNSDGTWTTVSTLYWAVDFPLSVESLSLTPAAVLGWDHRQGGYTPSDTISWMRPVGSSIGAESTLATGGPDARIVTSAARWVVPTGGGSNVAADVYDEGSKVGSDSGHHYAEYSPLQLSGPNLLLGYRMSETDDRQTVVENVEDGSQISVPDASGIFGSLVLAGTGDRSGTYRVQDLSGASSTISGKLTDPGDDGNDAVGIWGDWFAFTTYRVAGTQAAVVRNYRTGAEKTLSGYALRALGDGYAVVAHPYSPWASVWDFTTGATIPLAGPPGIGGIDFMVAVDGDRVAFIESAAGKLHVQTFDGLARSAPRSLGVVAAHSFTPGSQSWTVDVDLTKPVAAGQLNILNSAGAVARTIAVPATATGSLRAITWDGKDNSGSLVPPGTYSYTLTSSATDGTGPVVAVDGTARALGTVEVKAAPLTAGIPVISGTAATGSILTASPGSWSPTNATLTYQWLRDGQPISGATGASYVATAADSGHDVSVRVTGSYGGETESRTSAAVRVVTASFATTAAPTTSGTWFYGKTVTASAAGWSPVPDSLAWQWLRDGQPINGATGVSYTLAAEDVGRLVSVRVTAAKAGYATTQAFSAGHSVGGTKFTKTGAAKLSGTAKVGKTLTGKLGTFSPKPARIAYQWLRNGQPISGATKSKYKLVKVDKGKKVAVRITVSKPGYYPVVKASSAKKVK